MSPGLKVLAPGLHTTVQDLGRIGYQNAGVPVSGALDGFGLRVANALVGNDQSMAAIEILISGPTIERRGRGDRWWRSARGVTRGKSELHRAGCWLTASRGDSQDSATESRPPTTSFWIRIFLL
jgi:hypothetical protein